MAYTELYEGVHRTDTLSVMPLVTFSDFIGLLAYIVLSVAQCEHTTMDGVAHFERIDVCFPAV